MSFFFAWPYLISHHQRNRIKAPRVSRNSKPPDDFANNSQGRVQGALCKARARTARFVLDLSSRSSARPRGRNPSLALLRPVAAATATMMDCAGGRDPVEDFLLGGAGAGDDGDLVAVFCDDGGYGDADRSTPFSS